MSLHRGAALTTKSKARGGAYDDTLILVRTFALEVVENNLAHAHALRSHLHKLVALDVLETLLKAHHRLRYDTRLLVRAAGTHVGEIGRASCRERV